MKIKLVLLQNDISNQLNENNTNTKSMEKQQRDNLDNLLKTIKETESLIKDENIIEIGRAHV